MRNRSRARGAQLSPLWGRLLAAFAGGSVFTADRYNVDGGTGKVASYTDWLDSTHTIAQGTGANQHVLPVADSTAGNALVSTTVTSGVYASSRAASLWRYPHDGTGVTVIHVGYPASATTGYWATSEGGGAGVGAGFGVTTGPTQITRWRTTAAANLIASSTGALNLNAWNTQRITYQNGASPEVLIYTNGTQRVSGSDAAAPDTGDPNTTMRWFVSMPAGNKWLASFFAPRVLNAAQIALVNQWTAALGLSAV